MTKATVLERLTVLAKQLQFYWALGHLVTVAMALAHFLSRSKATFNWSLYGTLASYSLIVYKTHAGTLSGPGGMQDKARRLLLDENVQYFLLAGSWALSGKPLSFALVPFATFAAFHLLGFIRSEILAKVWIESASSPSTSSSATEGETPKASLKTRFMSTLGSFLTEYQVCIPSSAFYAKL